jgi:RimJ/RimL family protein N-acetyltransferase
VSAPLALTSSRLTLRRLAPADAAALVAYRSLPEVALYQSWEAFGPDDAVQLIADKAAVVPGTPGTWLQLAIVLTETETLIGDLGLHFIASGYPQQVELGVTLAPAYQGRGLATEAIGRAVDYVFGSFDVHRITATTDADNRPSAALFRRAGFRQEAHFVEHTWFKGAIVSEFVFAMLRREWEARRAG